MSTMGKFANAITSLPAASLWWMSACTPTGRLTGDRNDTTSHSSGTLT